MITLSLDAYDAGLLNDYGGGNVDWWWDYLRAELGRAHEFYQSQVDAAVEPDVKALQARVAELEGAAERVLRDARGNFPTLTDPAKESVVSNDALGNLQMVILGAAP